MSATAHGNVVYLLSLRCHVDLRADALECRHVIDPQRDGDAVLMLQLARQAPANADVAEVIDNFAK
jgi:hypothetical protein